MFLIDGYNLLHVARLSRDRLIDLVEAFCRQGGYRARMVFDPTSELPSRSHRGDLEIRSVAVGRTADEEILSALAGTEDRTAYTVVSNDRVIVREARARKVEVLACEDFLRLMAKSLPSTPAKEEGDLAPGEVDYWLREFGLEDKEGGEGPEKA